MVNCNDSFLESTASFNNFDFQIKVVEDLSEKPIDIVKVGGDFIVAIG